MTAAFVEYDCHGALYVYVRGRCIYKRWPYGVSRVLYLACQT